MWKYFLAWFPMIIVAIMNGLFREKVLTSRFGELQAHQLSTLSMIVLFGVYVWVLFKMCSPISVHQTLHIGLLWLLLTIAFELVFGHFVAGHSWQKLFHDYNILQGRVWVMVLIWIAVSPYIIFKLQN